MRRVRRREVFDAPVRALHEVHRGGEAVPDLGAEQRQQHLPRIHRGDQHRRPIVFDRAAHGDRQLEQHVPVAVAPDVAGEPHVPDQRPRDVRAHLVRVHERGTATGDQPAVGRHDHDMAKAEAHGCAVELLLELDRAGFVERALDGGAGVRGEVRLVGEEPQLPLADLEQRAHTVARGVRAERQITPAVFEQLAARRLIDREVDDDQREECERHQADADRAGVASSRSPVREQHVGGPARVGAGRFRTLRGRRPQPRP
jgi:hypothetical protein